MLGSPVSHSRSPALHRAAYRSLGIDWQYDAIEVPEGGLADFLGECGPQWIGFSLTMPLKDEAWAIATAREETAELTECANTLVRSVDGWFAANTDVDGLVTAIQLALQDAAMSGAQQRLGNGFPGTALIVGSGATARSAAVAAARLGITELRICARNARTSLQVLEVAQRAGLADVRLAPLEELPASLDGVDLCISTLPGPSSAQLLHLFGTEPQHSVLLDVAYNPWPSALAEAWLGAFQISGLEMLLWQAVKQVELMSGQRPSVQLMREALTT